MTKTDQDLISGFLTQEYDAFADYLDERDIEPTEAGVIIQDLTEIHIDD